MIRRALERAWWRSHPGLLSRALQPLSWLYGALWQAHRFAYAKGWRTIERAPVPVVVVGNLVVGGAGKTPTVIALVQALQAMGWTPGVISRGYRSRGRESKSVTPRSDAAECGDEPLLIARRTRVPVWVGRRRAEVARDLCAAHPAVDIIVADDGLQHLALGRDVQIVVFDERGLGNGLLLPAGPLREPFARAPGERTLVVYNAASPSTAWSGPCAQRTLSGALPLRAWWSGEQATADGLSSLKGRPLLAAAGIAAPQRFFSMLQTTGLDFERLPLPDHAEFDPRPWPPSARTVIVTEKDAVKLGPDAADADSIHVATLDFRLPADTLDALRTWLEPLRPR